MNKFFTNLILVISVSIPLLTISSAQSAEWKYKNKITFPDSDTLYVQPYLCVLDAQDRLYVISSKVTNADARNMIFYADSNDTQFTKLIDYFENGEEDTLTGRVAQLLGIAAIDNDIIVSSRIPSQQVPAGASACFYYDNGDPLAVNVFGFNIQGAGWGTPVYGLAANQDSIIIGAIPFQGPSFRFYNFGNAIITTGYGSWFFMGSQPMDPGGPHTNGFDIIRDQATVPGGDYYDTATPFYTSRNALDATSLNGGISVWEGGSINDPSAYTGQKVQDASGFLNFDASIPYGITVDKDGKLWVAGIDSLRRWVKGFELLGAFASFSDELPSQNSFTSPNPEGAPMIAPSDVAVSSDGLTAYVIDAVARCAFKFKYESLTDVEDELNIPLEFELHQNYPNPFNPSTMISFSIPEADHVRLSVSNAIGEEIAVLADRLMNAGRHSLNFDGSGLSSGVYYYTVTTNGKKLSKKMILIK